MSVYVSVCECVWLSVCADSTKNSSRRAVTGWSSSHRPRKRARRHHPSAVYAAAAAAAAAAGGVIDDDEMDDAFRYFSIPDMKPAHDWLLAAVSSSFF